MMGTLGELRPRYLLALRELLAEEDVLVSCLGACTRYLGHPAPRPGTFYLADSMGAAIPLALGMAIAQPGRRVIALEGDGSLLLNLGCLVTAAASRVRNLTILLFQNNTYESSGGQELPPAPVDFEGLARASGIAQCATVGTEAALRAELRKALDEGGLSFLVLRTAYSPAEKIPPYTLRPLEVRQLFADWIRKRAGT